MSESVPSVGQPPVLHETSPLARSETQRPSVDQSASSITFSEEPESSYWQGYLPSCIWTCIQNIIQYICSFWQSVPQNPTSANLEIPMADPTPDFSVTQEKIREVLHGWGTEDVMKQLAFPCRVFIGVIGFAQSTRTFNCWETRAYSSQDFSLYEPSFKNMIDQCVIDPDILAQATRVEFVWVAFSSGDNSLTCQFMFEHKAIDKGATLSTLFSGLRTDCPLRASFEEPCLSILQENISVDVIFDTQGKLVL